MMSAPPALVASLARARPLAHYKQNTQVIACNCARACKGACARAYTYTLAARPGRDFAPDFRPDLTPAQILRTGAFEGKYINDAWAEFPREWFASALRADKLRAVADPAVNAFGVKSRLSLDEWEKRSWIHAPDPRGWFQWYCRYWLGRRIPALDALQIARWKAFARHRGQILAAYKRLRAERKPVPSTLAEKRAHRARQRQALLQWAYDPWV